METKYRVGDIISWYCRADDEVHHAEVEFVNYAGAGYPDINYEVSTVCCGKEQTIFVDENDAMKEEF